MTVTQCPVVRGGRAGVQDFEGFLTIVLLPRHRVSWPAPGQITDSAPQARMGVRLPSLPALEAGLKPICAATIRSGVNYVEVPFFATHEGRRYPLTTTQLC